MAVYVGLAVADSMFPGDCLIARRTIAIDEMRRLLTEQCISCCNPGHKSTLAALRQRYGLEVPVPEAPPQVRLQPGDRLIVLSVRGLPRLMSSREYTDEEIAAASFEFSEYHVLGRES